jgi:integrase
MAEGVRKRGNVWYAVVEFPRRADGRRDKRWIPCRGMNQKQTIRRRAEIIAEIHNQAFVAPSSLTLAEYLGQWLERIRPNVSPTTHTAYASVLRTHLIPGLGGLRLSALRPMHVRMFYDSLVGRRSPKTVRNIHGVLCSALVQSVKLQLLRSNPAADMDMPKEPQRHTEIASPESLAALLRALQGTRFWLPVLVIVATGLRRGEALGLRWEDFREPVGDEEYGLLTVSRSVVQLPGRVIVKDTKSGRARVVAIPLTLVELLRELRGGRREGFVCVDARGELITPAAIGTEILRVCRREGISIRLHGLRHTYATRAIEEGVPVAIVSEIIGHANSHITEERYIHLRPKAQGGAVRVADELLQRLGLQPHLQPGQAIPGPTREDGLNRFEHERTG